MELGSNSQEEILYFAYGSNMLKAQLAERCPGALFYKIGYIDNSELTFPRSNREEHGVASYSYKLGSNVWGVIYYLSDTDLKLLRSKEGFQIDRDPKDNAYNELQITVYTNEGRVECLTYRGNVQDGTHLPSKTYLGKIITGAEEHQLPKDYVEYLKTLPGKP